MSKRALLAVAGLGLGALGVYLLRREQFAVALKLPPPRYRVAVERDIPIAMPDGVILRADRYFPTAPGSFPTVLVRTGYGRELEAGMFGRAFAQLLIAFAERGYHVLNQTTRGRFGSAGEFGPLLSAREDGLATLEWVAQQSWFNGAVGMWGASWLGYMQWAVAAGAPPYLRALAPSITTSQFYTWTFPDGAFGLDQMLRWVFSINLEGVQARSPAKRSRAELQRAVSTALMHLPLAEADVVCVGEVLPYYREYFKHPLPDDPYWHASDRGRHMAEVSAPVTFVSGWYDFFLRELLADYAALRAAGKEPFLTIGPWFHTSLQQSFETLRQGLAWFDAHLKFEPSALRAKPVRVYVMGASEWRELDTWPPLSRPQEYFLHAHERLSTDACSPDSVPDRYHYDPANPTPVVGGPLFSHAQAGPKDNRVLEARPDVLTYTTELLVEAVEIMGAPRVTLHVRSSLAHTDFFARLCDVPPDGRSLNITDGLMRVEPRISEAWLDDGHVEPGTDESQSEVSHIESGASHSLPDGTLRVDVVLWPTAYRFRAGHSIRLQVSSGAHPRWSRNLGTGEPIGSGTRMLAADQTVYHDTTHPSSVSLPVIRTDD